LNEPLEKAILREVVEETGIKEVILEYVGVVRENQGAYEFIHFVFVAHTVTEKPVLKEPEKCEGWEWISPDALPEKILPGHRAAIQLYQQKKRFIDLTK